MMPTPNDFNLKSEGFNLKPEGYHANSQPPVMLVGITGGIGSGKSYVCRQLEAAGHPVFYCDDEAKHIIRTDEAVRRELCALVGPGVYDAGGRLVKSVLAAWLCKGREYAAQVDAIVHPRVAAAFRRCAEAMSGASAKGSAAAGHAVSVQPNQLSADGRHTDIGRLAALPVGSVLFMECALLFESGFDRLVHSSVLVHVSASTQLRRLMERDHISREKAQEWIDLQMSEAEKLRRATYVLCNE